MTKVYLEQDGNRYTVSSIGHATGSVEACAAVSMLIQALDGWLSNNPKTKVLHKDMASGKAVIEYIADNGADEVFSLLSIGFLRLAETYPEVIEVQVKII
ncbi:MAG: ribosomal-processing cysteine protease Prp [Clostridiaceae bacterium]|nr:ribosomal-processing cysteine protease Prp [Clostridiaceae bacterium]